MRLSWLGAVACSVVLVAWGERPRCQDAWVGGVSDAPGFTTSGLGVYQLHPWGTGLAVAFGTSTYSPDHYNGLARLDQHGNLQWLLTDEKKLYYSPVFISLSDGHVLYFQSSSTNSRCMNTGANLHEIDENGIVLRTKFLDLVSPNQAMELQNGDILLISGPTLLRLKSDLTGFRWAEVFESDHPPLGIVGAVNSVLSREDGTLFVTGKYPIRMTASGPYYRNFVTSLGEDGRILWYKTYDIDPALYTLDIRQVLPTPESGCLLIGSVANVPLMDTLGYPYLARLGSDGTLVSQEVFCVADNCTSGGFSAALPLQEGGFLAVGAVSGPPIDWPSGFIMRLNLDDRPEWIKMIDDQSIPISYRSIGFTDIFNYHSGYGLPTAGAQYGEPPWVFQLDSQARLPVGCTIGFVTPRVNVNDLQVLSPCSDVLVARSMAVYSVCDSTPTMLKKDALTSSVVCGDAYPGVVSIKKLSDPLRLKIYGWNFEEGSQVLIDGAQAPATSFKGIDGKTGESVLMAKGGKALAKMMPKGQPVTITVLNSDGRQSVGFVFVR